MLAIEEMLAIFVTLIALQGFAIGYSESNISLMKGVGALVASIAENAALQKLEPMQLSNAAPASIVENMTNCFAYRLSNKSIVKSSGMLSRIMVFSGIAYVVDCNERPNNS